MMHDINNITLADLGFQDGKKIPVPTAPTEVSGVNGKLARGTTSSIEDRALVLLGAGIGGEAVANALGVTPARISQLLSEQAFSDAVSNLRYENLQKHNNRDASYDNIEDKLLAKLEQSLGFILKPRDLLNAINTINSAKRRGQSSPDQVVNQQNIVNLVLPSVIAEKFTVNIDNQVTRAGEQELHTLPASNLLKNVEEASLVRQKALSHLDAPITEEDLKVEAL
jgi:hypothetical protein